jgi:hypothetical protein
MTIFSLLCRSSHAVIVLAGVLILHPQELTAQFADAIAPPKNLWAAQNSPTSITLVWSSASGATGYRISAGGKIERAGASTLRWVVPISGGMFGKPFQSSIQTVNASGSVSERAEFPTVTPVRAMAGDTVPAPTSVTASQTGPGRITVAWSAVQGATAYAIGRSVAPDGLRSLCPLCPTRTQYVDSAVTAGAKHIYAVAAIAPQGTSRRTASAALIPTSTGGDAPSPTEDSAGISDLPPKGVTDPKAAVVSATSVKLTWKSDVGATQYRLLRSLAGGTFTVLATLPGTITSFLDQLPVGGLLGGVRYQMLSLNPKGSSAPVLFNEIPPDKSAVDTTTLPPKGVTDPKAVVMSATSVKLTWKSAVGATQYRLLRSLGGGTFVDIVTLAGTITSFLDQLPVGGLLGGVRYQMLSLSAKGSSAPVLFNEIPPDKGAVDTTALPPKGVTDPKAAVVSATSVKLTWKSDVGATQYRLLRSLGGGTFTNVATLPGTAISFLDLLPVGGMLGGVRYQMLSLSAKGSSAPVLFNEIPPAKGAADTTTSAPYPEPEPEPDLGPVIKP